MGCDIHVYVLKKQKDGTVKELKLYTDDGVKASIGENRNYALFSKLAGVRGYEKPISAGYSGLMFGLPENIIKDFEDCHTPRFFSWGELVLSAKYEGLVEENDIFDGKEYNIVEEWLDKLRIILDAYYIFDIENIYVQIFFDN